MRKIITEGGTTHKDFDKCLVLAELLEVSYNLTDDYTKRTCKTHRSVHQFLSMLPCYPYMNIKTELII